MSSQVRNIDGRLELWIPIPLPGGWVCGEPDDTADDGMCGMPVESEPCSKHWPNAADEQGCPNCPDGFDCATGNYATIPAADQASGADRG